jgi:hypothetical protein
MKLSHTYLKSSDIQTKINNNLTTHTSNKSIPPTISTQKIHNRTKFMKAKACMERKTQHNMIRKKKSDPTTITKLQFLLGLP